MLPLPLIGAFAPAVHRATRASLRALALAVLAVLPLLLFGCSGASPATPQMFATVNTLAEPYVEPDVSSVVAPPIGWTLQPLLVDSQHTECRWLSPSGDTAYGVIRMNLPGIAFFASERDILRLGVLPQVEQYEGSAQLQGPVEDDPAFDGIRYTVLSDKNTIRMRLTKHGVFAWTVYAGTRRNKPIDEAELDAAKLAAEHTIANIDPNSAAARNALASTQHSPVASH